MYGLQPLNAMTTRSSSPELPGFTFVLFGGTGDLAMRKILPALYAAHRDGMLAPDGRIVAVAQNALDCRSYLQWVDEHVRPHIAGIRADDPVWRRFVECLTYIALDASQPAAFIALTKALGAMNGNRIFYLATGPALFVPICRALAAAGLNEGARVVLEKPLGHD